MSKAAVVQMVSGASVSDNLAQAEQFIEQAREQQADLVALPENFAFMGHNERDKLSCAESFGAGEIQDRIRMLAKKYQIWILAGTVSLAGNRERVRAASLIYDDKGQCAARYDKIHLFDVRISDREAHQESLTVERGEELTVVDTPLGKLGLTVCYDLRFPEIYRQLAMRGAELFAVPSAFTATTGMAHWEVLLRARAIENLCYVLAPNQGGRHTNGRHTHGHSMIIDPWGKILAQQHSGMGVVTAELDLQGLGAMRLRFPCNEHHILI